MLVNATLTEMINEVRFEMREQDITSAQLAERMHIAPGRLSQILSGGENLTAETISQLATGLGRRWLCTLIR